MENINKVYGILLIFGGLMGFRKGSKMSLMMGSGSGLLVLYLQQLNNKQGIQALSGLLALIMGFRAREKFMPSGMVALLSLIILGLNSKN